MNSINIARTVLIGILSCMLVVPLPGASTAAEDAGTKITHTPLDTYLPGYRIQVTADIEDRSGIKEARCYFKAKDGTDFLFVAMERADKKTFQGVIPAPWLDSKAVDYFFLVLNGDNKVVRSQVFEAMEEETAERDEWKETVKQESDKTKEQIEKMKDQLEDRLEEKFRDRVKKAQRTDKVQHLSVKTDAVQAPQSVPGFHDRMVIGPAGAGEQYGMVAATTVTAGTGGMGTGLTVLGIAVAIAGVAAAAGGGGGGGGGGSLPAAAVTWVWDFHFKCAAQSSDFAVVNVTLNETNGGPFNASGIAVDGGNLNLTGQYTSSTHLITGDMTTTYTGVSCVRRDTFSSALTSPDTGYINMTQTQSCGGCDAQVRMIRH